MTRCQVCIEHLNRCPICLKKYQLGNNHITKFPQPSCDSPNRSLSLFRFVKSLNIKFSITDVYYHL